MRHPLGGRHLLASVLLLVALAPTAAAAVEQHDAYAFGAPDAATLTRTSVLTGDDARAMRAFADRDRDGAVSPEEADEAARFLETEARDKPGATMLVEGEAPRLARIDAATEGLAGPVDADPPVVVTLRADLSWDVEAGRERYNLTERAAADGEAAPATSRLTLRAPTGYVFSASRGIDGATLGTATLEGTVPQRGMAAAVMSWSIDESAGASSLRMPLPAAPLVALALAGAAVALRRRA